jgi:hypothetical protein
MAEDAETTDEGRTAADYSKLADTLRARVDLFGKSLAGIATLGTGAVGLTKVADLAPLHGWDYLWVVIALVALVASAWAAVMIAIALMQVNQPVVLDAETALSDLTGKAKTDVEGIFTTSARRFGFSSLLGLQERERSLRKAASRASSEVERTRRTALADEAQREVELAIARARLAVVRRRAAEAVSGASARTCYLVVVCGLLVFALFADVITSDRTDAVATAKACGEARKAGASANELKGSACDAVEKKDEDKPVPPTAEEARTDLVTKLNDVLKSCVSLAAEDGKQDVKRPLSKTDCDRIAAAVKELLGG